MSPPAPRALVLRAGRVVTMDGGIGDLARGDVLVEAGRIAAVGERLTAPPDAEEIDCAGAIVLPGLVDAHRHVWQATLRGVAASWTLLDYFLRMRSVHASLHRPEDAWLGNHQGALEGLASGVTTLVDHCHVLHTPEHADAALQGLVDVGIRGVFCYGLFASPMPPVWPPRGGAPLDPGFRFADARRVAASPAFAGGSRLVFGLAPSEVETMAFDDVVKEIRFARELGAHRISCHVAMGRFDAGNRLVARLSAAGLLRDDLLFVHGASFDEDELARIAAAGAGIAVTPETELQMGMGRPVAFRAAKHGIATGLGADIVSNYAGDLFAQMRLLLQAERGFRHEDRSSPPRVEIHPRDVLRFATIEGARAAGLADRIGSITPGKRADLVVVRTDAPHLRGVRDPVAALVLYASTGDVDTVLVDGEPRKRGGRLVGVDEGALGARLEATRDRLDREFAALAGSG